LVQYTPTDAEGAPVGEEQHWYVVWPDLHRFYFMLLEASRSLQVPQLKAVYTYYMQRAHDNMVAYGFNFSSALVVAMSAITPQGIVSALAPAELAFSGGAHVPGSQKRPRGGKGSGKGAGRSDRNAPSSPAAPSTGGPRLKREDFCANFNSASCPNPSACLKVHRCLRCNERGHGVKACPN